MSSAIKKRRSSYPLIALSFLAFFSFSAATLGCATTAEAHSRSSRISSIDFDDLYVTTRRGAVVVEYEISRRDWHRLQSSGVNPRMELYLPRRGRSGRYAFHDSHRLRSRQGTVTFYGADLGPWDRSVQVSLAGTQNRSRARGNSRYREGHRVEVMVVHARPERYRGAPPRGRRGRSSIVFRLGF